MSVAYAELQARLGAMTVEEFTEWYTDFVIEQNSGAYAAGLGRGVMFGHERTLSLLCSPPTSDKINC